MQLEKKKTVKSFEWKVNVDVTCKLNVIIQAFHSNNYGHTLACSKCLMASSCEEEFINNWIQQSPAAMWSFLITWTEDHYKTKYISDKRELIYSRTWVLGMKKLVPCRKSKLTQQIIYNRAST